MLFGLFQYNVMPFGLATATATFMRLMTLVFSKMLYSTCLAYLDYIIIFGRTFYLNIWIDLNKYLSAYNRQT